MGYFGDQRDIPCFGYDDIELIAEFLLSYGTLA